MRRRVDQRRVPPIINALRSAQLHAPSATELEVRVYVLLAQYSAIPTAAQEAAVGRGAIRMLSIRDWEGGGAEFVVAHAARASAISSVTPRRYVVPDIVSLPETLRPRAGGVNSR
jgi:hypothetical protein